jgi:hypothetical protein
VFRIRRAEAQVDEGRALIRGPLDRACEHRRIGGERSLEDADRNQLGGGCFFTDRSSDGGTVAEPVGPVIVGRPVGTNVDPVGNQSHVRVA